MTIARRTLALLLGAAVALAACGGSDDTKVDDSSGADTTAVDPTAVVPASAGALPVLANGGAPAERTFTISANGIEPASVEIAVGENVTFVAGDDAIYAIGVGGLDAATVTDGLIETFDFPAAGTYIAVEEITGTQVTIVVG